MPLFSFEGKSPRIHPTAFIAPTASIIGDVTVEENASVWYNTVIRADFSPIVIRRGANVQDCAVIHVTPAAGVEVGPGATIGHLCLVHAATLGEECLVGNSSTVLDGARIGVRAMVAAGSLVTPNTEIPDGMLAMGAPCKVKGPLAGTAAERWVQVNPAGYQALAQRHRAGVKAGLSAMPPRHVLVTGFEPFGGDAINPSQELAKRVDGRVIGGHAVRSLVLPVQHEAAREMLRPALEAEGLDAVVHLGLAGGRARISLERVGVNVMDYRLPDALGDVRRDEACAPGGPAAYWSTLPLRAIEDALRLEGIPAHASYTAGAYLCNYVLYTTLHALEERGHAIPAGFVHLPFLPSMVAAHALEEPSMDLGVMARGLETILRVVTTA